MTTESQTPLAAGCYLLARNGHTRFIQSAGATYVVWAYYRKAPGCRWLRSQIDRWIEKGRFTVITADQNKAWEAMASTSINGVDKHADAATVAAFVQSLQTPMTQAIAKCDAMLIADLLDDERETLTEQLCHEEIYGDASSAKHWSTVAALAKAGLVDTNSDACDDEIELTPRGRRIARAIAA